MKPQEQLPGTPRLLRAINDRTALELLWEHGCLSRTELGRLTGLSKPTASALLMRLEASGLVVEVPSAQHGVGRTAQLYEVNAAAGYAVALDVTIRETRSVLVNLAGEVLAEHTVRTSARARDVVDSVSSVVDALCRSAGLSPQRVGHVVIGVPGAYDHSTDRLLHVKHLPGWARPGLRQELADTLDAFVEIENDVNLVALAEHDAGVASEARSSVLLWSAIGVGAAIVLDGRLHRGHTGSAGEVGYLPVAGQPRIPFVARDNTGGFALSAGTTAILALGRSLGLHGSTPERMVAAALAGVPRGEEFLDELAIRYATGIAAMTAVVDPEIVVLSGPILQAGGDSLRERIQREVGVFSMRSVPVRLGQIQTDAVLTGARLEALARMRSSVLDSTAFISAHQTTAL